MNILKKLTNTKTVFAIAGSIVLILNNLGIQIDNKAAMTILKAVCSIFVLLGIMNNTGMDTTNWNDKKQN